MLFRLPLEHVASEARAWQEITPAARIFCRQGRTCRESAPAEHTVADGTPINYGRAPRRPPP